MQVVTKGSFMASSTCLIRRIKTLTQLISLKLFDYVESLGYRIKRYDRISDGCSSQFWCWGTMKHLEDMTERIPLINFHRYERYEGKNMSDALGSMVKRKSNDSALRQRLRSLDEEEIEGVLENLESGKHKFVSL